MWQNTSKRLIFTLFLMFFKISTIKWQVLMVLFTSHHISPWFQNHFSYLFHWQTVKNMKIWLFLLFFNHFEIKTMKIYDLYHSHHMSPWFLDLFLADIYQKWIKYTENHTFLYFYYLLLGLFTFHHMLAWFWKYNLTYYHFIRLRFRGLISMKPYQQSQKSILPFRIHFKKD